MTKSSGSKGRRKPPVRRYNRQFTLVCEGAVTEPQYFAWLKEQYDEALIKIQVAKRKPGQSSPQALIKHASQFNDNYFRKGDELWIILDKDQWTEDQFTLLLEWQKSNPRNHLAVSSPKFEYWLLLHEKDYGRLSPEETSQRFQRTLGKGKNIITSAFTMDKVQQAILFAKRKHNNPDNPVPEFCGSTVYRLIEHIEEAVSIQARENP